MISKPTPNAATRPTVAENSRLQLSKITKQGQYVNRQTGHLLIVDEKIEKALSNNSGLFNCFVTKDQGALDFTMVSENWKQPIEEVRTAVSKLSIPVNF